MSTECFNELDDFDKWDNPFQVGCSGPGLSAYFPDRSLFSRHDGIPGHNQAALAQADITLVGAGGLNSWVALGLARSGARHLRIVDPDRVEDSNLSRQFFTVEDVGRYKATRLVHNLAGQMTNAFSIDARAVCFEEAVETRFIPHTDLLIVGVDNNACRFAASQYARCKGIPAVFTMLSRDAMRCHCFLQGPSNNDACLWCALPNLDPETALPCAAAIISSCFLAASLTLFFAYRSLMGWPEGVRPFNWREADLTGGGLERTASIERRPGCTVCRRAFSQ